MPYEPTPFITDEAGNPSFAGSYDFGPGKADRVRKGYRGAILSYGALFPQAYRAQAELKAKHGLKLALLNFVSIKPLNTEAILDVARTGFIVTVEDHHADTGFGGQSGDHARGLG